MQLIYNERVETKESHPDYIREFSKPFESMFTTISANPEVRTISKLLHEEIIIPIFI